MTAAVSLLRSFVAVPLPVVIQTEIAEAARTLARDLPAVKWARKTENLHITVKFLGPVTEARLAELGAALGQALHAVPSFGLGVRGFGAFPSPRTAKVVFAGIEDPDRELAAVAEVVETVSARFGVAREERPFSGHVTIGRSRTGVDAQAALAPWAGRGFGTVAVDEVHVYESRLGGEGSTYVLRGRAKLATTPGAGGAN
jgi:RNA 2',3'-cyclic 3'-phosphodiesterase